MITASELRLELRYEPLSGQFWWLIPGKGRLKNRPAGCISKSRRHVYLVIRRKQYLAHRLAWLYMTGNWPEENLEIDHINGVRHDNRWTNLRLATVSQNKANCYTPKNNTSGYRGVYFKNGKWEASCQANGKRFYLGTFTTKEDAHIAYTCKAKEVFGVFFKAPQ